VIVGLVHPGDMGAAIGAAVSGHEVIWASEGRSDATRARAGAFRDVRTLDSLASEAGVILSVCPPHAALDVARSLSGFGGIYVDANAISPMHAREIAALHPRFVDGGIIGGPASPRLYLSGDDAAAVAGLFTLDVRLVPNASALKMTYAAWSKGTAALLLAIRDTAKTHGTFAELEDEWRDSLPELLERLPQAERSAAAKGWRWIGEMEEIADTFGAAGQPEGFHRAAAEVFRG
jgi:hypothetical protein